jgi:hypothetical protein
VNRACGWQADDPARLPEREVSGDLQSRASSRTPISSNRTPNITIRVSERLPVANDNRRADARRKRRDPQAHRRNERS